MLGRRCMTFGGDVLHAHGSCMTFHVKYKGRGVTVCEETAEIASNIDDACFDSSWC